MSAFSNKYEFTTPVGRLVAGDAFEPQTTDQQGNPLLDKNQQPTCSWFVGVAFDKNNPEFRDWYSGLVTQSMRDWPHLFDPSTGACKLPTFSMKVIDGDGVDQSGRPWAEREGYAGHYVVRFSSGFKPSVFYRGKYDPMQRVTDPAALPRGYFVRIAGSAKGNGNDQKPGMYMNLNIIEIVGIGPIIMGGPDAAVAFGNAPEPAYIPSGMTDIAAQATMQINTQAGAAGMPNQVNPAAGMAGMPNQMNPAAGMVGMPNQMNPAAGMAGMPNQMNPAAGMAGMPNQMNPAAGMAGMPNQMNPAAGSVAEQALAGSVAGQVGMMGHNAMVGVAAGTPNPGNPITSEGYLQQQPGIVSQGAGMPNIDPNFVSTITGTDPAVVMGPNAQGMSYEQWRARGLSDEQLRSLQVII